MTHNEQLAWAAGFFDGEGHTGFTKSGQIIVSVAQADAGVLLRFRDAVGVGKVRGPYVRPSRPSKSPLWVWQALSYEHSQHVIATLWYWLSDIKRQQAVIAFERAKVILADKKSAGGQKKDVCKWGHTLEDAYSIHQRAT